MKVQLRTTLIGCVDDNGGIARFDGELIPTGRWKTVQHFDEVKLELECKVKSYGINYSWFSLEPVEKEEMFWFNEDTLYFYKEPIEVINECGNCG